MGFNPSSFSDDMNRPVENVTWFDAALYCNELSKREGLDTFYIYTEKVTSGNSVIDLEGFDTRSFYTITGYRLPTEAEWEFSCRAGTTTDNYWGSSDIEEYVWHDENSANSTQPVGHKLPNPYGLYDMAGNVWEWCNDWHDSYDSNTKTDPIGPLIPLTGHSRVRRGNSWDSPEENFRASYRSRNSPSTMRNTTGFRVVRSEWVD